MRTLLVAMFIFGLPFTSLAEDAGSESKPKSKDGFFGTREDGWHWYEDPPIFEETPEKEEEEPPVIASPAPESKSEAEAPAPLSTAWIRETLPILRDKAIDDPSSMNVSAYMYAQRIMMDKAQVFSDRVKETVESDPLLDENLRLPFASAAKVAVLQNASNKKRELMGVLKEKMGLWIFYDETCIHCKAQIKPINRLVEKDDLTIEVISLYSDQVEGLHESVKVRKDNGQFQRLGINFKPAVMMVVPPDGYYLISQGFTAYTTLVDRVLAAANRYGLISQDEFFEISPTSKGVLRADAIKAPEVDWDATEEWVPFVQRQIRKTYGLDEDHEEEEI